LRGGPRLSRADIGSRHPMSEREQALLLLPQHQRAREAPPPTSMSIRFALLSAGAM